MNVYVIDREGNEHVIPALLDWPLMECIKAAGLPIPAECGGCCLCATCHVYVEPQWLARLPSVEQEESNTLQEAIDAREHSRLSCQIRMTAALDGLRLRLAPVP
jgi:ferredoxin, 2Fe-2S